MSPRRREPNLVSQVQTEIEKLMPSPLKDLGQFLRGLLDATIERDKEKVVIYTSEVLARLPEEFDARFLFDSYMIRSITDDWSQGPLKCSAMILPTYHEKWAHEALWIPMTTSSSNQVYRFDLIYIRRENNSGLPWLLDYPWLLHELGHYLLSAHGKVLADWFTPYRDGFVSTLRRRSIADRNIAKTRAEKTIEEINSYWELSPTGDSWAKELAIDTIALWSCGPAYLAAYMDDHEQISDPYQIDQKHPPVELRTRVLLNVAHSLGWQKYTEPLEKLQLHWKQTCVPQSVNKYYSLFNEELIEGCLKAALDYCQSMKIPPLRQEDIDRIGQMISRDEELAEGIDLIVGAWLVYQQEGPEVYEEWERRVTTSVMAEVTP